MTQTQSASEVLKSEKLRTAHAVADPSAYSTCTPRPLEALSRPLIEVFSHVFFSVQSAEAGWLS